MQPAVNSTSVMMALLRKAMEQGLLRPIDVQFSGMIAAKHERLLQLAAAVLSRETAAGHTCLPVENLQPEQLFDGRVPALAHELWQAAGMPDRARRTEELAASPAVSDGSQPAPLVLQQGCLYLHRMWQSEGVIARFFSREHVAAAVDEVRVRAVLDALFPAAASPAPDWQKIAAAVAVTSKVSVIAGGPGTGKTTTVTKLLAALLQLTPDSRLRIQLTAPTGKAAARLTRSLALASHELPLTSDERRWFPQQAVTLHRLLGVQPESQLPRYHRKNSLSLDVLVVDEAAMIDLNMMACLTEALPDDARVIFLGDRAQLASVEAGAVFGDICRFAEAGYTAGRAAQLTRLTGYSLPGYSLPGYLPQKRERQKPVIRVCDSLCLLRKSYRFSHSSGIGQLALAINAGAGQSALSLLTASFNASLKDVEHFPSAEQDDYRALLQASVASYQVYLGSVARHADPAEILTTFGDYQLLCALREGPFGVNGLNERIERQLQQNGLITPLVSRRYMKWYAGRPVMINRNDSALGLFNGDVGVALFDVTGCLRVWFRLPDGAMKSVHPGRLPEHETAYAITVHKSQGSEFAHVALVLPNYFSSVLTRELLYTAITRARQRLTIYAGQQIFAAAIGRSTQRCSRLAERLTDCATSSYKYHNQNQAGRG